MRKSSLFVITLGAFALLLVGCSSPQSEAQAPVSNSQVEVQAPVSNPQAEARAALAGVCSRRGVAGAGAYAGEGVHPVVLLSSSGEDHDWSDDLPHGWAAQSVEDAQLVACVDAEQESSIEVCEYIGPDITRYRYEVSLRLVEAQTGAEVASTVLGGNDPRQCQQTEAYDLTRLAGDPVSFAAARDWMQAYVEGSAPSAVSPAEPAPPGSQPSVEVSVFCGYFGVSPVTIGSGQPILLYWKWGAASDDYLQDYVDAATFELRLDGEIFDISAASVSTSTCEDAPRCVTWRLPPMTLGEGAHDVVMTTTLSHEITDGLDLDQNGELDTYPAGPWEAPVCEIIVE